MKNFPTCRSTRTMTLVVVGLLAASTGPALATEVFDVPRPDNLGELCNGTDMVHIEDSGGESCTNTTTGNSVTCHDGFPTCVAVVPREISGRFNLQTILTMPPVGGQTNSRPRNQPAPASLSSSATSTDVGPTVETPPFDPGPTGPAFPDGPALP